MSYRAFIRALSISCIPVRPKLYIFKRFKGFLRCLLHDNDLFYYYVYEIAADKEGGVNTFGIMW